MTEQQPPNEQAPDEQQRKRRRWRVHLDSVKAEWSVSSGLTLAGSGFLGALLVVGVWWIFHHQSQVEVPNLVGVSHAVAEAQLKDRGLNPRATYDEVSDQPAGTVLRTDPAAGTKLDQGGGVSLVLAIPRPSPAPLPAPVPPPVVVPPSAPVPPPRQVPVPNVVGLDQATAKQILTGNGLMVGSVTQEESNQRAPGVVLRTNPPANTIVQSGSPVDLVVAKMVDCRVPNVGGYDLAMAKQILTQYRLSAGSVTQEESNQRAPGVVLRTNPPANTIVRCGSSVDLVVAKAPVPQPEPERHRR